MRSDADFDIIFIEEVRAQAFDDGSEALYGWLEEVLAKLEDVQGLGTWQFPQVRSQDPTLILHDSSGGVTGLCGPAWACTSAHLHLSPPARQQGD